MTRIVVHIDQLGLHGLQGAEARAVVEALRGELGARLAPGLDLGQGVQSPPTPLRIAAAGTPAQLGSAAAGAVASAIQGPVAARGRRP